MMQKHKSEWTPWDHPMSFKKLYIPSTINVIKKSLRSFGTSIWKVREFSKHYVKFIKLEATSILTKKKNKK